MIKLRAGDTIRYHSKGVSTNEYRAVVNWVDEDTQEAGVSVIAPDFVRGAGDILDLTDESLGIEVIEEFKPTYLRRNLSEFTVEELKQEIEQLRAARAVSRKPKPEPKNEAFNKLSKLSPEELDKLLGE